jgi:hypothetical protein
MLGEVMAAAVAYDLPDNHAVNRLALMRGADVLTRAGVQVPPQVLVLLDDWRVALAYLGEFLAGRQVINGDEAFDRVRKETAALAERDPLAALLPAAALVGQWEGTLNDESDWLFSTRSGARNGGWHGVVLPLARIMAKIPALWSARQLVAKAIDTLWFVRFRPATELNWHTAEAVAGFRELRDRLDSRYIQLHGKIARDIQHASRPAKAPIRSAIAALWWTLGDPWHAHGVADGTFTPTLRQVLQLTDRILRSAFVDPMLAATGARLWQGPGLQPERHESAHRRMTHYYPLANEFAEFENVVSRTGVSPANAYARALTSYFADTSSAVERDTIRALVPHIQAFSGRAAIRMTALHLLLETADGQPSQQRWAELAQQAAATSLKLSYRHHYSYDRSLDLPLYYLEGGQDYLFDAVEHHRSAAMDFQLRNLRPLPPTTAGSEALVAEEGQLLDEVRLLSQGGLPTDMPGQPARGYSYNPEPALANRIRRLNEILTQLTTIAPDYAAAERYRASQAADLARAFGTGPPALR